jgi:hypothetical protein
MSYAGHVLDMINRIKANEAHKKARRKKIRKVREAYMSATASDKPGKLHISNYSREELERIKIKIRKDLREQNQKKIVMTSITVAISLLVAGLLAYVFTLLTGYRLV